MARPNKSLNRTTSASHSVLMLAGRSETLFSGKGFSVIIIFAPGAHLQAASLRSPRLLPVSSSVSWHGKDMENEESYLLVNFTKKEFVMFKFSDGTAKALAGDPAAAAVITWYFLNNLGDHVSLISESFIGWPASIDRKDFGSYREVEDEVIDSLLSSGILIDDGTETYTDEDLGIERSRRILRNIWHRAS